MDTNESIIKKQPAISKQKRKKPFTFALIFLAVCVFSGIYIYASNPVRQLQRCLDNEDYTNAIVIYNDKIKNESDKHTFDSIFLEHITSTVDSWMVEEIDYKEAAAFLEIIEGIDNDDISKQATTQKEFILLEGKNSELHQKAEECYSSENYIGAMDVTETINPEYSQASSAQNLYDVCKEIILAQVANPTTVKAFDENITLLEEYLILVDEPDFLKTKLALEKDLIIFKDVINIIENAETLYDKGEFKEAFVAVETGLTKYPAREELVESNNILHEMYVVSITQQIKIACEEEDYKTALSIVDAAIGEYDCEEFQFLKESVKEQKSWLYRTYKGIKEKFNALTAGWRNEEFDVKKASADAGAYILKSGEKIVLGDYSDEDITVLSMSGNIVASVANFDLLFDIRDLAYDVQHIGEEEYFVARIATDVVALLPVIGVVKYLKYTDEIANGVKTASNVVDQVADAGKTTEQIADAITTAKTADNIADAVDNASDVSKNADTVADATQDVAKHYRHEKTINQNLKDKKHPVSGILFKSKKLEYSDGRFIEGVFPVFKSKFDFNLEPKYYKSDETVHFAKANEGLKEALENNKLLKYKFNKSQLADIEAGNTPNGYTWHHNEEEGLLQLVDRTTHNQTNHTGGMKLWGKGYGNKGE